jgi:ketol-acid reductoisomerase
MPDVKTTTIYYDSDADLKAIDGMTVAVVGYGNQGRSQALNIRDAGVRVIVGNISDASFERARTDGFETMSIADSCQRADIIMLLVPDEVMPAVYREHVVPKLVPGKMLDFASGYNIAFGEIVPPKDVDVVLIAPRMIGPGVRDCVVAGKGFPSFIGVHQDASGKALARLLGLAKALGTTRAGCIAMSMHDEACLDLFTEQAFGPAFGRVMMSAIETMIEAGYPPEAVLLELYLSGELIYSFQKILEVGMLKQMDYHSHTSQYGTVTRSARFADFDLKSRMHEILGQIQDGTFAKEWSAEQERGAEILDRVREMRAHLPMNEWETRTRRAFKIGDAA